MNSLKSDKQSCKRRAIVVGIDGVPFSMLNSLIKKKRMKNTADILNKGYFGKMSVCIPEISSVSWSSFMTGVQPGDHGIFGFIDIKPGGYDIFFPNFNDLKAIPMWTVLEKDQLKSVVLNMPATYPAPKMEGTLISGFVAVDINKAVHPSSYISTLNNMGYKIDIDLVKSRQDNEYLFKDLEETLNGRYNAVNYFWDEVDWSLFIVVITGTDRLMHFLWSAYENEDHVCHSAFLDYFEKVDRFVGNIYERYLKLEGTSDGYNQFYMLSDHGFSKLETEVYLNRWLQENGYLKFKKDQPETIMDIGDGSKAFAMDPSRIYINLKEKYPRGSISSSDYEKICLEIKEGLKELTYKENLKVIKGIYHKEEIYSGAYLDNSPDLLLLSHSGYDLKGRVNSKKVFGFSGLEGMHTQNDAFFYSSKGDICDSIFDAKKIILDGLKADRD